jgi:hypothetical protein
MNMTEMCLLRNGALYAKTVNLEGALVEVCELGEIHDCKYRRIMHINGYRPVNLCLYEICTYESHLDDKVFIGADFVMKEGEEE